jgi:hypothetical protein
VLGEVYARELADLRAIFDRHAGQGACHDRHHGCGARAATMGAIDTLMVDMDEVVPGTVDETVGQVTFRDAGGADSYDVIDEIACRARS